MRRRKKRRAAHELNEVRHRHNNFGHIGPHNTVQQPVIQFGTAIHGKDLSGGALNYVQKPLRAHECSSRPRPADSRVDSSARVQSPGKGSLARIRWEEQSRKMLEIQRVCCFSELSFSMWLRRSSLYYFVAFAYGATLVVHLYEVYFLVWRHEIVIRIDGHTNLSDLQAFSVWASRAG